MKKKTVQSRKITLKTSFTFVKEYNANSVAISLARSGYYVNMLNTTNGFVVDIYEIIN